VNRVVRVIAVLALITVAAGCDPGELDLLLEDFPLSEMSSSDDPAVRASGETAVEVLSARQAESELEQGFRDGDLDAVRRAQLLRPGDTRYLIGEAILLETSGSSEELEDVTDTVLRLARFEHPELSHANQLRVVAEDYISSLREAIAVRVPGTERDGMISTYCRSLTQTYPNNHTEADPAAAAVFLATADYSLCS
jgi:hypothetical protein